MKKLFEHLCLCFSLTLLLIGSTGCSDTSADKAIETVKNGYLGEYTDMTVSEILDGYYGLMYENIEWGGGTTDSGKTIVQVEYTSEYLDPTKIQFTMLNEACFKVTAMIEAFESTQKPSDVAALINYAYLQQYLLKNEQIVGTFEAELAFIEVLNSISGSSALYGASKDYPGDRSQLYQLFGDSPLDLTVPLLLDAYGKLDLEYYVSGNNAGNGDTIVFDTEYYSLTLPAYWEDLCIYEQWDIEPYSYGITFYEKQSYDDFNGEGGVLFSLALEMGGGGFDYPDTYLGELRIVRLANYDVVATFPTDVEFSNAGRDNYMKLNEDISGILASFTPQPEIDCEYIPAI